MCFNEDVLILLLSLRLSIVLYASLSVSHFLSISLAFSLAVRSTVRKGSAEDVCVCRMANLRKKCFKKRQRKIETTNYTMHEKARRGRVTRQQAA